MRIDSPVPPRETFNVKSYGAAGDGLSNDTAAILAADSAARAGGGVTWFPPGNYVISASATYTHALTTASGSRWMAFPGSATLVVAAASPVGTRAVRVTGDDVLVAGLVLQMADLTDATGFYLSAANRVTLSDLRVTGAARSGGIHIVGGVFDLLVERYTCLVAGYGILALDPATGGRWTFRTLRLDGADGMPRGDGISLNCPTTGIAEVTIDDVVANNYDVVGSNSGFGVALTGISDVLVSNVRSKGCGRNGIHIEDTCDDVVVSGFVVTGHGQAGVEVQAVSGETLRSIRIASGVIRGCCTNPAYSLGNGGLEAGSGAAGFYGGSIRGLVVSDVDVYGTLNGKAGIFTYESRYMRIHGGTLKNNTGPGLSLTTPISSVVSGVLATDDQVAKTQTYGLSLAGSAADCLIHGNNFRGNLTGATIGTAIGETLADNLV